MNTQIIGWNPLQAMEQMQNRLASLWKGKLFRLSNSGKHESRTVSPAAILILAQVLAVTLTPSAEASTAYGTLNNFDCVNDTGSVAHGFEIELDDIVSTDITYTYDYNHYGVPKISQDNSNSAHPKVFVRYAATRNADGTWSAYTAIPSGPISPTDGHQFTNPSVNFGGEHFGVGYTQNPTAVKYNWLIDDGSGNLVHGPAVYIATPTFTYVPPAPAQPPQVQPVIVPPPPPEIPVRQFGTPVWVKDIKTTTHNSNKMELRGLIDPDPDNPAALNWTNGEPAEVETEWRILQTEFGNPDNPKGELAGVPQELPGGDEVVTRRYEFFKYNGPIDAESGEAMADQVGPDGTHGVGSVTYNDHIDPNTGEWVTVTADLSTIKVVGDFIGAQMSGFDVAPALGLIDHIPDGELGVPYVARTVVIAGGSPFFVETTGALPGGMALDDLTGVFSGVPSVPGVFNFTVNTFDLGGTSISKTYTVTIASNEPAPVTSTIVTTSSPAGGGTTAGGGIYQKGAQVTVIATHSPGFAFVLWTEGGVQVSNSAVYPFTVNGDRTLVANFVPVYTIVTSTSPILAGTASGGGIFNSGDPVTLQATANAGYHFVSWTEAGSTVSNSASYAFSATASRNLTANFAVDVPVLAITSTAALRDHGKVTVVFSLANTGWATAQNVAVDSRKSITLDGKMVNDHGPFAFGNLAPGATASSSLTFTGIKAGSQTLQLNLIYQSASAVVSTTVLVP